MKYSFSTTLSKSFSNGLDLVRDELTKEGFDILTEVILSDTRWTERRHALRALGKFGKSRYLPIIIKALKDKHLNVRVSAVRALGNIGDPAALPTLTELLNKTEITKINAPTTVGNEARKAIEAIKAVRAIN